MAKKIVSLDYYPKGSPIKQYEGSGQTYTQGEVDALSAQLQTQKQEFKNLSTENLWGGYENQMRNLENVYEDVTIPQEAYNLKRRQREQSLATSLQAFKESGFGAGGAQLIANTAQRGAAEDTAQISENIYKNELLGAGEASRLQILEAQGETEAQKMRIQGAVDSRNLGFQKQQALMSLTAGEMASIREADAYKSANRGKIICNELYNQGYLSEDIWDADEKFGEKIRKEDPKLLFGYHIWAIYVVNFMKAYPQYTKYVYMLTRPWTEYMANEMGVIKKNTIIGKISNWVGTQFSYYVANRVMRKNKGLNLVKK